MQSYNHFLKQHRFSVIIFLKNCLIALLMCRELEQLLCVVVSDAADLLRGDTQGPGDEVVDVGDEGALVALAAVRDGREVGGVGLQQQAVESDDWQQLWHGALLESDHAVHAEIEITALANTLNVGWCSRKAVEDARRYRAVQVVDDVEDIVKSLVAVHDERHSQLVAPV